MTTMKTATIQPTVVQGVDYLNDPTWLIFVQSELDSTETPVWDLAITTEAGEAYLRWLDRLYWTEGPGSEPIVWGTAEHVGVYREDLDHDPADPEAPGGDPDLDNPEPVLDPVEAVSDPEWQPGTRADCPRCERDTALRRDGSPVRHKHDGMWCVEPASE